MIAATAQVEKAVQSMKGMVLLFYGISASIIPLRLPETPEAVDCYNMNILMPARNGEIRANKKNAEVAVPLVGPTSTFPSKSRLRPSRTSQRRSRKRERMSHSSKTTLNASFSSPLSAHISTSVRQACKLCLYGIVGAHSPEFWAPFEEDPRKRKHDQRQESKQAARPFNA